MLVGTPRRFVVPVKLLNRDAFHVSDRMLSVDIYPGDRTEQAASRLRAQHNVSKDALGGLVLAPIDLKSIISPRILDCGTADGYWLYDLSTSLKLDTASTTLVGTDIGAFPESSFQKTANISLSLHSYKDPWPLEWRSSFDFVHMRFCVAGLADPTEAQVAIDRLVDLVKPGGWIQLVDSTLPNGAIEVHDQPSVKLFKAMGAMLRSRGQSTDAGHRIAGLLYNASPNLQAIETKAVQAKLGAGSSTESLKQDGIANLLKMLETLKTKLDG